MKAIKAQKIGFVNYKTLIGAVDIGKETIMGYFQGPEGQEIKPFSFSNEIKGISQFWYKAIIARKRYGCDKIIVGFESTGPYGEPFRNFMKKTDAQLVQVNPMHTKKIKHVIDNSPGKTDKKDPKVIVSLIKIGSVLSFIIPEGPAAELRERIHSRERRMKERTACINTLGSLVFRVFPEFCRIFKNTSSKTAFYLMENYPTPDKLKELKSNELTQILKIKSRGRFREEEARKLLDAANNSLGIKEGISGLVMEINYLLFQIKRIDSFIEEIEKDIEHYLEKIPYSKRILSMKGIGLITVAGVIGEVADFRTFNTQSEILKLAGLDLYEISSGKHTGRKRISKRGRPLLRKLLYFAALNTVRKGGIFHNYYQRLIERGKEKPKALIAVARKILMVMFAIVRDKTDYIENHKSNSIYLKKAA